MKFGMFYEHQLPRPWSAGRELRLYQEALDQVTGRIDAAGIPSNRTEDGLLIHDPSENGVILSLRNS